MNEIKVESLVTKSATQEALERFRSNPLLYWSILLGVIGLFFPALAWLLETPTVHGQDLEKLREDVVKIQKNYQEIQKTIDKVMTGTNEDGVITYWHLTDYERQLFEKLATGRRNPVAEFFRFIIFLIQGAFFFLLGILAERKFIAPRMSKGKDSTLPKPAQKDAILPVPKDAPGSKDATLPGPKDDLGPKDSTTPGPKDATLPKDEPATKDTTLSGTVSKDEPATKDTTLPGPVSKDEPATKDKMPASKDASTIDTPTSKDVALSVPASKDAIAKDTSEPV